MKVVYRYVAWTLALDQAPDAEPITHAMQCATCDERSEAATDFMSTQDWALAHTDATLHITYRQLITLPWRAEVTVSGGRP